MREYVYSVVCFSCAAGLVLMLAPDGVRQGLKKHVKFIGALCLICILIKPTTDFLDAVDRLGKEDFSGILDSESEGELYDKYEEIYQNYLDGSYGENIGEAVKDALDERFNIEKENCRVLTEFSDKDGDGVREPKKITVVLSGEAKFKEPESIKSFVSELFECDAAVAIE